MKKFFLRFFILFLATIISSIIYISYFGVSTDKFDDLIKNKANEVNRHIKLEFRKTKIHLNLKELNLAVRLQNPTILIRSNEIILSKLDLFLSLKSFFSSDFLLKRAEVAFIRNDIKDLTKITNIFLPRLINKQLDKIFVKGNLEGKFVIPFESDGSLGRNYGFSGKISNAIINLTKEFSIKNLTAEINDIKNNDSKGFQMIFKNGSMSDLDLADTTIKLSYGKNEIKVNSLLRTKGKFDYFRIKKISSLFNLDISNFNEINGVADLKTSINFNLDDKFRIKDSSYSIDGNIEHFEIHTKEKRIIKKYLPEYDPKIILKDANLKLVKSKSNYNVKLSGYLKVNKNLDTFNINKIYNFDKKSFHLVGTVDLTNSKFRISRLNYRKNEEKKASLGFDVNFVVDKYYNINKINFYEDKNKIELSKIKLNKNFEVVDLDKIKVETFLDKKKNNDFLIKKSKKITISGQLFDAQPLLKSLYKKSDKRTFSKKFSSEVKINFDNMITGTNDDISNFATIALINKGSYEKLSSKGNFSDKEIVEISIYKRDGDKKTLQVISDRARPFVKNFDFIKGF